jgi:hypothetical protein
MANLLLDYTALDAAYKNGKFRFVAGDNAAPSIADPADVELDVIKPTTDGDPVLFSYLKGSSPRALLVNINTNFDVPPTSTGKYTVCVPDTSASPITWKLLNDGALAKDITLVNAGGSPVAGNPHGIAAIGNYLYTVDYDSPYIYRLDITAFEGKAAGSNYQVTTAFNVTPYLPTTPSGLYHHGAALISLTTIVEEEPVTYLYALFTSATLDSYGYPDVYAASTVIRFIVNTSTGAIINPVYVRVGQNATGLIPAGSGSTASILVPAIGGKQNYGSTNGTASNLTQVTNIFATLGATTRITGDNSTSLSSTGNYDIMGFAVSANGNNAYILLVTYNANTQACWRLYKGTLANILAVTNAQISQVTTLTSVATVFGDTAGYYWEILYDNTVTNGRLWFLKGTPIRVNAGNNYDTLLKDIKYPLDGSVAGNVNGADLIGEMLYQAAQGVTLNTRLGTTRQLAKTVQAAKTAAEEEERK